MAKSTTKRVKGKITIKYQMTESRAARLEKMVELFIHAIRIQPYPNESINPDKGDYLDVVIGELKHDGR